MIHRFLTALLLAGLLAGCASVPFVRMAPDYSTVPADSLAEVALAIEQAVRAGDREPVLPQREGVALSDSVVQAVRTRAARGDLVNEFLNSGHGYEASNGLIKMTGGREYSRATTRRQRDRNALMVMNENEARWRIYEGILKASNYSQRSLPAIQDIFFRARVETLVPGQLYEGPDGRPTPAGAGSFTF